MKSKDSNSKKSVSYQKKAGCGHARLSFFWYDKDLKVCFLMMHVTCHGKIKLFAPWPTLSSTPPPVLLSLQERLGYQADCYWRHCRILETMCSHRLCRKNCPLKIQNNSNINIQFVSIVCYTIFLKLQMRLRLLPRFGVLGLMLNTKVIEGSGIAQCPLFNPATTVTLSTV